ncbi:hypothetical protein MNV49_004937 [Pseudohyphozyma bogoriensis]|nr:hypothetical protein MNV49_004937 [Pseudohyphozyma bogoriensis]
MDDDEAKDDPLQADELLAHPLSATLEHLHAHLERGVEFDDRVVLQLLLTVYAGHKNIVLRIRPDSFLSPAERSAMVHRLAAQVAWLCASIWALSTHRVACTTRLSSSSFLKSIFLPPLDSPLSSAALVPQRKNDRAPRRAFTSPAQPPADLRVPTIAQPSPTRPRGLLGIPLSVDPAPYDDSSAGEDLYPNRPVSPRQPSPERRRSTQRRYGPPARRDSGLTTGSKTPPLLSVPKSGFIENGVAGAGGKKPPSVRSLSTRGAPTPVSFSLSQPPSVPTSTNSIPKLQRSPASPTSPTNHSRSAPLPNTNARRTPPLASVRRLSAEIYRPQNATIPVTRQLPEVLILERIEKSRPSVQQALLDVLREKRVSFSTAARAPKMDDTASSMATRRTGVDKELWEGSYNLPARFFVVAIVMEEDERGEGEKHDGAWGGSSRHLMDHFSLSHTLTHTSSLSTFPLHLVPEPASLLVYTSQLLTAAKKLHLSPPLVTYMADLISTLRHHPLLESRMLTAVTTRELELFTRLWVVLSKPQPSKLAPDVPVPLVLPADVLAMVTSVVGHRLRLRAVEKEKSTFWGSDVVALKEERVRDNERVEDVLRRVIKAV